MAAALVQHGDAPIKTGHTVEMRSKHRDSRNATPSATKPRVFVLTDISNEPDDEKSLVRFLVYTNEFDLERIVAL